MPVPPSRRWLPVPTSTRSLPPPAEMMSLPVTPMPSEPPQIQLSPPSPVSVSSKRGARDMLDADQRVHALAGILGDALDVEVDGDAGGRARREGDAVDARAAVEQVVALAAVEIIVAIAAEQLVVAVVAAHEIVAVAAVEQVVALRPRMASLPAKPCRSSSPLVPTRISSPGVPLKVGHVADLPLASGGRGAAAATRFTQTWRRKSRTRRFPGHGLSDDHSGKNPRLQFAATDRRTSRDDRAFRSLSGLSLPRRGRRPGFI